MSTTGRTRAVSHDQVDSDQFHSIQIGYNRFFIDRRYSDLKPAGDGSYGFVASALDTVTGERVAIKKIKDVFHDVVDAKRILREMKLLRHFNSHENIISIVDVMIVPPYSTDFSDVYIVTNLMESDLERIIRSRQRLTDQHFQYFLYQILRALKYVHSANVLHRDLKPSNLLVNANCDLAICDFGLARGFRVEGEDTLTEYVVTRWYRSPELLCESHYYGKGVDIWSTGCIFAELLTHEPFFRGDNPQHQLEVIVSKLGCPPRGSLSFVKDSNPAALESILKYEGRPHPAFSDLFPRGCNPLALELIGRMLTFDPETRITVEEALSHPYLREFHGQMDEPNSRDLFDFAFELGDKESKKKDESNMEMDTLSKVEVKKFMFEEMLRYRPFSIQKSVNMSKSGSINEGKNGDDSDEDSYMDCDEDAMTQVMQTNRKLKNYKNESKSHK